VLPLRQCVWSKLEARLCESSVLRSPMTWLVLRVVLITGFTEHLQLVTTGNHITVRIEMLYKLIYSQPLLDHGFGQWAFLCVHTRPSWIATARVLANAGTYLSGRCLANTPCFIPQYVKSAAPGSDTQDHPVWLPAPCLVAGGQCTQPSRPPGQRHSSCAMAYFIAWGCWPWS
jgi:hypothetical protein